MKKMLLVYNPHAGHGQIRQQLHEMINLFTADGYLVTAYPTQFSGDATEFVKENAVNYDILVVSGGDGTLHECVNALMALPILQRPPVGYLPAGTANDFAASHGITPKLTEAADVVLKGTPALFDIGQLGDAYFTYVAAFGIFTDVTYDTPQDLKSALGYLAYVFEGANRLSSYKPQHMKITVGNEIIEGDFVLGFVSNTTSVGGIKLFDKDIDLHDGLSELFLIRDSSNPIDFLALLNSLALKDYSSPLLIHRQAKEIRFESDVPVSWTLDGEYGGTFESVVTKTCPDALPVMVKDDEL